MVLVAQGTVAYDGDDLTRLLHSFYQLNVRVHYSGQFVFVCCCYKRDVP